MDALPMDVKADQDVKMVYHSFEVELSSVFKQPLR